MLRLKKTNEKLEITSIPPSMMLLAAGCIVFQIGLIIFVFSSLQSVSYSDFFGYAWFDRIMNVAVYSLPIMFAGFIFLAMPIVKVEINSCTRIVSIRKLTPFRRPRKFGFDYIKGGIHSNLGSVVGVKTGALYFELESGEKIDLIDDNSATRQKALEIIEISNKFLNV